MGRLMPNFLYFKYALWADLWLCPNFYTANKPYGQTSAKIFILKICRLGRLMPKFLYFKYSLCGTLSLLPTFYNILYSQVLLSMFIKKKCDIHYN